MALRSPLPASELGQTQEPIRPVAAPAAGPIAPRQADLQAVKPAVLTREDLFAAVKRLDPAIATAHPSLQPWPARIGSFIQKVEARESLVREAIEDNSRNYRGNDVDRKRISAITKGKETLNGANEVASTYEDRYLITLDVMKRHRDEAATFAEGMPTENRNKAIYQAFAEEMDQIIKDGYATLGLSRAPWETTMAQVRSKDFDERARGMASLSGYSTNVAARHIVEGLHDSHYAVRRAALASTLEISVGKPEMRAELGRQAVEFLVDLGTPKDPVMQQRREAIMKSASKGIDDPTKIEEFTSRAVELVWDLGPQREVYRLKTAAILWSEGGREKFPKTYNSFREVESAIRDIASLMAADRGGYDKTEFLLTFEDGMRYEGRIDVVPSESSAPRPLRDHVSSLLNFYAGNYCPPHMTKERYEEHIKGVQKSNPKHIQEVKDFLTHYSWED